MFQSLGCLLYALCYFKSPFDAVYERGDSVALAVMSGTIFFPEPSPFPQVNETYMIHYYSNINFCSKMMHGYLFFP